LILDGTTYLLIRVQGFLHFTLLQDLIEIPFSNINVLVGVALGLLIQEALFTSLFHSIGLSSRLVLLNLLQLAKGLHNLTSFILSLGPSRDLILLHLRQVGLPKQDISSDLLIQGDAFCCQLSERSLHSNEILAQRLLLLPAIAIDSLLKGSRHRRLQVRLEVGCELLHNLVHTTLTGDLGHRELICHGSC